MSGLAGASRGDLASLPRQILMRGKFCQQYAIFLDKVLVPVRVTQLVYTKDVVVDDDDSCAGGVVDLSHMCELPLPLALIASTMYVCDNGKTRLNSSVMPNWRSTDQNSSQNVSC